MSSSGEGPSETKVPQTEEAAIAWEGGKANARGMAVMLGGMLSTPWDAMLTLANTWCYLILQLGKLWQKEVDL